MNQNGQLCLQEQLHQQLRKGQCWRLNLSAKLPVKSYSELIKFNPNSNNLTNNNDEACKNQNNSLVSDDGRNSEIKIPILVTTCDNDDEDLSNCDRNKLNCDFKIHDNHVDKNQMIVQIANPDHRKQNDVCGDAKLLEVLNNKEVIRDLLVNLIKSYLLGETSQFRYNFRVNNCYLNVFNSALEGGLPKINDSQSKCDKLEGCEAEENISGEDERRKLEVCGQSGEGLRRQEVATDRNQKLALCLNVVDIRGQNMENRSQLGTVDSRCNNEQKRQENQICKLNKGKKSGNEMKVCKEARDIVNLNKKKKLDQLKKLKDNPSVTELVDIQANPKKPITKSKSSPALLKNAYNDVIKNKQIQLNLMRTRKKSISYRENNYFFLENDRGIDFTICYNDDDDESISNDVITNGNKMDCVPATDDQNSISQDSGHVQEKFSENCREEKEEIANCEDDNDQSNLLVQSKPLDKKYVLKFANVNEINLLQESTDTFPDEDNIEPPTLVILESELEKSDSSSDKLCKSSKVSSTVRNTCSRDEEMYGVLSGKEQCTVRNSTSNVSVDRSNKNNSHEEIYFISNNKFNSLNDLQHPEGSQNNLTIKSLPSGFKISKLLKRYSRKITDTSFFKGSLESLKKTKKSKQVLKEKKLDEDDDIDSSQLSYCSSRKSSNSSTNSYLNEFTTHSLPGNLTLGKKNAYNELYEITNKINARKCSFDSYEEQCDKRKRRFSLQSLFTDRRSLTKSEKGVSNEELTRSETKQRKDVFKEPRKLRRFSVHPTEVNDLSRKCSVEDFENREELEAALNKCQRERRHSDISNITFRPRSPFRRFSVQPTITEDLTQLNTVSIPPNMDVISETSQMPSTRRKLSVQPILEEPQTSTAENERRLSDNIINYDRNADSSESDTKKTPRRSSWQTKNQLSPSVPGLVPNLKIERVEDCKATKISLNPYRRHSPHLLTTQDDKLNSGRSSKQVTDLDDHPLDAYDKRFLTVIEPRRIRESRERRHSDICSPKFSQNRSEFQNTLNNINQSNLGHLSRVSDMQNDANETQIEPKIVPRRRHSEIVNRFDANLRYDQPPDLTDLRKKKPTKFPVRESRKTSQENILHNSQTNDVTDRQCRTPNRSRERRSSWNVTPSQANQKRFSLNVASHCAPLIDGDLNQDITNFINDNTASIEDKVELVEQLRKGYFNVDCLKRIHLSKEQHYTSHSESLENIAEDIYSEDRMKAEDRKASNLVKTKSNERLSKSRDKPNKRSKQIKSGSTSERSHLNPADIREGTVASTQPRLPSPSNDKPFRKFSLNLIPNKSNELSSNKSNELSSGKKRKFSLNLNFSSASLPLSGFVSTSVIGGSKTSTCSSSGVSSSSSTEGEGEDILYNIGIVSPSDNYVSSKKKCR